MEAVAHHNWVRPIMKNIATKYAQSILADALFKSDPKAYMRRWYALRSKSDGKIRFPEDKIHEIIQKELDTAPHPA